MKKGIIGYALIFMALNLVLLKYLIRLEDPFTDLYKLYIVSFLTSTIYLLVFYIGYYFKKYEKEI